MFDDLVERRIREAQQRGEFSGLPGEGKPLTLEDDRLVPEELRVAYRILKNAGFVPPEVDQLNSIQALIGAAADKPTARRWAALSMALERAGLSLTTQSALPYQRKLMNRLSCGSSSTDTDAADTPSQP
jgi:Domain of unknown function (DUF1992)